jgi:hypothetical protein
MLLARRFLVVPLLLLAFGVSTAGASPFATSLFSLGSKPLVVYISPTGSDANACTSTAPCASFDRAYRAVASQGLVLVGDGSYPEQVIQLDPSKTGAIGNVIFRPVPGSHPTMEKVMLGDPSNGLLAPSHVSLVGLTADSFEAFNPATYITWIGLDANNFYIRGAQHMLIKGGDWGPCNTADPACDGNNKLDETGIGAGAEQANDDITIDGATIHDYRIGRPDDHFECMFIAAGTNITIQNSKFYGCEFYDIFLQHFDTAISHLTIQNNWFDTPWNGAGVQDRNSAIGFSPRGVPFSDVLIRYNSFAPLTGIAYDDDEGDGTVYSNFRIVGNLIGTANFCDPERMKITFEYNIFGDGFCGATDSPPSVPLAYVAGGSDPWQLTAGGVGVDVVPGTDADQRLSTDMYGHARPVGSGWDAGAVERAG